jgi:hypothetical protein
LVVFSEIVAPVMAAESSSGNAERPEAPKPTGQIDWIESIRQQVASLRFGVIQIVVHEGRVVQIDRTEKIRVESKS